MSSMLSPDAVLALLPSLAAQPGVERVPLARAHGCILAEPVIARADVVIRREPGASALAAGATVPVLSLD